MNRPHSCTAFKGNNAVHSISKPAKQAKKPKCKACGGTGLAPEDRQAPCYECFGSGGQE